MVSVCCFTKNHSKVSTVPVSTTTGHLEPDTGTLLMAPGKTSEENLRFITFVVNTLMAVYRHNGLLKASIMSATNTHRLGGHEAPPAIISSFLGTQLSKVLDHLEESTNDDLVSLGGKQGMKLDIPQIPELLIDNTDRNRTSPFAFTGNRFEFRAPGSEANCASAMIALNTAVAEQLIEFKKEVDELIEKGEPKISAIIQVSSANASRNASLSASTVTATAMSGR